MHSPDATTEATADGDAAAGGSTPRFLRAPPRFLFFTGKGGVGKTSLACAAAVALAARGEAVLLVSTDPASNVGQVFGATLGNRPTAIEGVAHLSAIEIDPQAAAQAYRDRIVGPLRGTLPNDEVRAIEERLSGACTTEIAAFDEFTGLLTATELGTRYAHILFDTAPTGHTLRLLQLPGAWASFLATGAGEASCLGPLAGLQKQRERYLAAVAALGDPDRTRMVLVARAQPSALREAARTHDELERLGLRRQYLVVNGVYPADEVRGDPLAEAVRQREQRALSVLPPALQALPRDEIALVPFDLVGLAALREMFEAHALEGATDGPETPPLVAPSLAELVDDIAAGTFGLVMVMGKGGVGKTTLAAAIAVALAERGHDVHLTTSDPAAHLAETLDGALPHLTVDRIDPQVETARYRQHVLQTKGATLDAPARALLEEDLRSPCTEEIAVFQAFSRVIREAGRKFVVMDTAPTGHTLLLLDTAGAYHRDIERQLSGSSLRYHTPMMSLRDPARTKVLLVTLAETTPVLEAARLQEDLRRAGIEPWAWIINNSVAASGPTAPLLRRRAMNELREIAAVRERHARRHAVVPLLAEEPVGVERLRRLTRRPGVVPRD